LQFRECFGFSNLLQDIVTRRIRRLAVVIAIEYSLRRILRWLLLLLLMIVAFTRIHVETQIERMPP
jgi:hypothetical protein